MNNLITRTLTGSVLVSAVAGAIFAGSWWLFALFFIVTFFAVNETMKLMGLKQGPFRRVLLLISLALYLLIAIPTQGRLQTEWVPPLIAMSAFLMLVSALWLVREDTLNELGRAFFTLVYAVVPFALAVRIPTGGGLWEGEPWLLMSLFILIWANDTFAYLFGIMFGKHRLFERISPKKSWEGWIGGLIMTLAFTVVLKATIGLFSTPHWLLLASITVIFGTFGDLTESLLKRSAGIKDSGNILPGHGGILDRFDAMILAAPFYYFCIILIY
ncbi:MAG: phosphatidate cytidylyltransferase [Sphingobacteriia bacterium]|nr:phosphatidate cytidylyltransferase [Sphingobacteriia bacterium]